MLQIREKKGEYLVFGYRFRMNSYSTDRITELLDELIDESQILIGPIKKEPENYRMSQDVTVTKIIET